MSAEEVREPAPDVSFEPHFVRPAVASAWLQTLRATVDWRRDEIRVFGRSHPIPRLHQWYGDAGTTYRWSGLTMRALPWLPPLQDIRACVERATGARFNSVLVNLYRDGRDSMGWHADDEPELGERPVIASLSLGATRDLLLRRKARQPRERPRRIALSHGSLLVMRGDTQEGWQHSLPRRKRVDEPRINLTFRYVLPR